MVLKWNFPLSRPRCSDGIVSPAYYAHSPDSESWSSTTVSCFSNLHVFLLLPIVAETAAPSQERARAGWISPCAQLMWPRVCLLFKILVKLRSKRRWWCVWKTIGLQMFVSINLKSFFPWKSPCVLPLPLASNTSHSVPGAAYTDHSSRAEER